MVDNTDLATRLCDLLRVIDSTSPSIHDLEVLMGRYCVFFLLSVWGFLVGGAHGEIVVPDGITFDVDVAYGTASVRQRLDILYPTTATEALPAIIHIHGGGWYTGGKGGERTFAMMKTFVDRGYVAVSIEYRLSDDAVFPAAVEDCKLAVRWLRANGEKYHIDTTRIAALGASAGGHLTAMLAVARMQDGLEGDGGDDEQSSAIQAAVPVAAPFDLQAPLSLKIGSDDPVVTRFLGGTAAELDDVARRASPITYVRKELPPMLIMQGTEDFRVDRRTQADPMIAALEKAGASYGVVFVEGGKHGMGIAREAVGLARIIAFFDRTLK